jgi:hypothetical protein
MGESRIQAIDDVHLEAPPGIEGALRWFYGRVAGLDQVKCGPSDGAELCFKSERIVLCVHLVNHPRITSTPLRLTVNVISLDEVAQRLDERKWHYSLLRGILFTDRRIETLDPAGNRVALKRHWPTGPM